ncbi:hypothetical protein FHW67_002724 [Herbaspirillum sp. Sphag1AN]|uniref:hypothetical protein n=1 Tax=unclassified Herbaspirillum TaxID=2624150 RepID=UPI00160D6BF3|nr:MULTISPECIES: hypothetical protein [unclassified Herbaspirillum]MBB3213432.1 hypothetical protein [Herbaspirillum sp. Sphag1AN]MBB3246524.1 hypothetical protein [Herbaspirillum sp. Sphag64]
MAKKDDGSTTTESPGYTLVVAHPFGDYERGSAITDPAEIEAVMSGENAHHVRKVTS